MAQQLNELEISEVSVVDRGACRQCKIALFKRDDSGDVRPTAEGLDYLCSHGYRIREPWLKYLKKDDPGSQDVSTPPDQFVRTPPVQQTKSKKKGKKKMSKLKQVIISAKSRDQIVEAVQKKAARVAVKEGISKEAAEARVWAKRPELQTAYENTAKAETIAKREPAPIQITKSEARATDMAMKLAKREGLSFAQALSKVFLAHPDLYLSYELEKSAGQLIAVPGAALPDTSDKFNARSKSKSVADHGNVDEEDEDEDEDQDDHK